MKAMVMTMILTRLIAETPKVSNRNVRDAEKQASEATFYGHTPQAVNVENQCRQSARRTHQLYLLE
jgi:hypothetical protein